MSISKEEGVARAARSPPTCYISTPTVIARALVSATSSSLMRLKDAKSASPRRASAKYDVKFRCILTDCLPSW